MKKITLSVSEPCHQNWEGMTPEQKGRFCSSCQKTVVDFTTMSDRQIAEFFKQPSGSTCGRFYTDQLNRPIEPPRKRSPWIGYLFQFTWPAFILFLKSCGQKQELQGKEMLEQKTVRKELVTMGFALPEITPIDTAAKPLISKPLVDATTMVVGDVSIKPIEENDSTAFIQSASANRASCGLTMGDTTAMICDTTVMVKQQTDTSESVVVGTVAVSHLNKKTKTDFPLPPRVVTEEKPVNPVLYPNPVHTGQQITVQNKEAATGTYQVFTLGGQLMMSGKFSLSEKQPFTILIGQWPAGTYVLRLTNDVGNTSATQKFIVL